MTEHVHQTRRVKIVATLGPASASVDGATALARAGVAVFRINAAHLKPEGIAPVIELSRTAERNVGWPVGVFCDLAGPKLRVVKDYPGLDVNDGAAVTFGGPMSSADVRVEGMDPVHECPVGSRILVHDGKIVTRVVKVESNTVRAEVLRGGRVMGGKGVNLPDVETSLPSLTEHDRACLAAALAAGVDAISLSFVRRAEDVVALRSAMTALGRSVPVIAKLEKAQAVEGDNLVAIIEAADVIMIARGDLGAETAPERVPVLQKRILHCARVCGVPTITATEMLESMIKEPRPTRAEAADVANAVFDGTDAVMLSGETAVGAHPALVVETCAKIVAEAEAHGEYRVAWAGAGACREETLTVADAVAESAASAAEYLKAAAVVCFTNTGLTARLVARHRPPVPILALTPSVEVMRALTLVWGVRSAVSERLPADHEEVVRFAECAARSAGLAAAGELLIVTHGAPVGQMPTTNLMRVHTVRS